MDETLLDVSSEGPRDEAQLRGGARSRMRKVQVLEERDGLFEMGARAVREACESGKLPGPLVKLGTAQRAV